MSTEVLSRPVKNKTLEMNAKNTISLPYSEILRIKNSCNINEDPEKEKKIKEKLELNDKSKGRVKNWPNTLEAKRKKKDEARFERFKEDEEERRRIDKEEAEYQAQVKKAIIEKANKQIYEQNNKVKGLQGKMLLSDALLEREGQIEINKRKAEMEKNLDRHFHELGLEKMAEIDNIEKEKQIQEQQKKLHVMQIVKEQHEEQKAKLIKRIQEEKIEGEIIKRKDIQAQKDQMREEEERRFKHIKNNEEAKQGNEVMKEIKKQLKEKENEEDKKIEYFAKKKEEMLQMRKMREEIKFREKQNERQRLIDSQVEKLKALKDTEDARINKQIEEAQIRAEEVEKEKRQKLAQLKANIDESLKLSLAKKQYDAEVDKKHSNNYQAYWKSKNQELQEQENKEKSEYRQRCKELADFHKLQADERTRVREEQFMKELEEADKIKTFLDLEDKTFNSWAERCIKEWQEAGKNIKPLLLQLQKYKKISLE